MQYNSSTYWKIFKSNSKMHPIQMQKYKYSHLVYMRTTLSMSRYKIGKVSEPLRAYAILRKSRQTSSRIKNQRSLTFTYLAVATPANGLAKKMRNSQTEAAYDSIRSTFRACSYYPACRDISPSATNISVHSYKAFHPACRNEFEILFISASETCTFQSRSATIG